MANIDIFDSMARRYDTQNRQRINQLMLAQLQSVWGKIPAEQTLLDFGCGTGEVGLALSSAFEKIIYADASPAMLAVVAEKKHTKPFQTLHVTEDQKIEIKADYIVAAQVLLHIPDYQTTLEHLYECLNPGGTLTIIDFNLNQAVSSDKVHPGFAKEDLLKVVQKIGFINAEMETFLEEEGLFMKQRASLFSLTLKKKK